MRADDVAGLGTPLEDEEPSIRFSWL